MLSGFCWQSYIIRSPLGSGNFAATAFIEYFRKQKMQNGDVIIANVCMHAETIIGDVFPCIVWCNQ